MMPYTNANLQISKWNQNIKPKALVNEEKNNGSIFEDRHWEREDRGNPVSKYHWPGGRCISGKQCEICAPVPQENTRNSWQVTTNQHSHPAGSSWHYSTHQPVWANSFCLSTHVTNTETDYILIDKTNLNYLKH